MIKCLIIKLEHIRKQYGKIVSQKVVTKDSEITGKFLKMKRRECKNSATITLDKLKGKQTQKKFIGAKVGDVITFKNKRFV